MYVCFLICGCMCVYYNGVSRASDKFLALLGVSVAYVKNHVNHVKCFTTICQINELDFSYHSKRAASFHTRLHFGEANMVESLASSSLIAPYLYKM